MFTEVDVIAAVFGLLCALFAHFNGPRGMPDGANALLGFASGAAAAYLACMGYAIWRDGDLLERMIRTNPVIVFGAFLYGAYINVRTIPGLASRPEGRRFSPYN